MKASEQYIAILYGSVAANSVCPMLLSSGRLIGYKGLFSRTVLKFCASYFPVVENIMYHLSEARIGILFYYIINRAELSMIFFAVKAFADSCRKIS